MSDSSTEKEQAATENKPETKAEEGTNEKHEGAEKATEEEEVIDPEKAMELLAQGKRHSLCGEIPKAVSSLQEACRCLAKHYGEFGDEVGEAYLAYGRALLDLSRMESGVLGNALQGMEEEEEESANAESEPVTESSKDEKEEEEGEEEGEEETPAEGEEAVADGDSQSADDDVSNLQLAWEVLELAKSILAKRDSSKGRLQLALAYMGLGEVSIEKETYDQAIDDLNSALKLRQAELSADNRLLAETHYNLGAAYEYHCKHDSAIEAFQNAVNIVESRIVNLNKVIEEGASVKGKEIAAADDPMTKATKERDELRSLLPDMMMKIEDTRVEKLEADKVKALVKENMTAAMSAAASAFGGGDEAAAGSAKEETKAADISHLVRKKRKPESEEVSMESPTKKKKVEIVNGHQNGNTNGSTNGDVINGDAKADAKVNGAGDGQHVDKMETKTVEDVKAAADATV